MPLTEFDVKGIPGNRRERIEATWSRPGSTQAARTKGWIATDVFRGGVKVLITGPQGFERTLNFLIDEDSMATAERVRETLED